MNFVPLGFMYSTPHYNQFHRRNRLVTKYPGIGGPLSTLRQLAPVRVLRSKETSNRVHVRVMLSTVVPPRPEI